MVTPLVWAGRGLAWAGRTLVAAPLGWIWRSVLVPVGRGLGAVLAWTGKALLWVAKALFFWPWAALWRYVLAPVGRGLAVAVALLVRVLLVTPLTWIHAQLLAPSDGGSRWLSPGCGGTWSSRRSAVSTGTC